jgi:predicted RNA-binding Zn-ribbon protein involved in translation (DUF1610 family)
MESEYEGLATIYRCENCDCVGLRQNFTDVRDVHLRFEPGDTYTDAECPKCGALAFPKEVDCKQHTHRWSGWPGAFCLKCGAPHMLEQALADDKYDPCTDTWADEEYRKTVEDFDALCPVSDADYNIRIISHRLKRSLEKYEGETVTDKKIAEIRDQLVETYRQHPDAMHPDVQIMCVEVDPKHIDKINMVIQVPAWAVNDIEPETEVN